MARKIWYIVEDNFFQGPKRVWKGTSKIEANKELVKLIRENTIKSTIYWIDFEWKI